MKNKICCTCKKELPRNEKYFFRKTERQILSTGEEKIYYSFRSNCKECHAKKVSLIRLKKQCEKYGCTPENYKEAYSKKQAYDKLKYKELLDIPQSKRHYIREKIDKGYEFISIEKWNIDTKENTRIGNINKRKYDYGKEVITRKDMNNAYRKELTPAIIANRFKISVSNLPKEIYETQKLIIQLKREIGLTHSTKKQTL